MKFRTLYAALAVSRTGSATRASTDAGATQPAITAAITQVEAELGLPLFTRTARGMSVTAAGEVFCARVDGAFGHLDMAEAALRRRRGGGPMPNLRRVVTERQLRALSALLEAGSFMAAARALGVTQPNIHRLVRDLETLAGVALWRQEGAIGEATADGRLLARAGDLCRREIGLAVDAAREQQGHVDGSLLIGALPLSRTQWVPRAMVELLRQFPQAQVRLVDGPYAEQLRALRHGRIDLIVGALRDPAPVEDVEQIPTFDDALTIAVRPGHPLLSATVRGVADLPPDLTWVLPAQGAPGRTVFERHLQQSGCPAPKRVIECGSLVATRALLLGSDFAAPLSMRQIQIELEKGLLAVLCGPLPGTSRPIGLTLRRGFQPTLLYRQFMDLLISGREI